MAAGVEVRNIDVLMVAYNFFYTEDEMDNLTGKRVFSIIANPMTPEVMAVYRKALCNTRYRNEPLLAENLFFDRFFPADRPYPEDQLRWNGLGCKASVIAEYFCDINQDFFTVPAAKIRIIYERAQIRGFPIEDQDPPRSWWGTLALVGGIGLGVIGAVAAAYLAGRSDTMERVVSVGHVTVGGGHHNSLEAVQRVASSINTAVTSSGSSVAATVAPRPPVVAATATTPIARPPVVTATAPIARPPVAAATPTVPIARPPVAAATPTVPIARPSVVAATAPVPIARPPLVTATATVPIARPPVVAATPTVPIARPPIVTATVTVPIARPPVVTATATVPIARPPVTTATATVPIARPPVVAATPTVPIARPPLVTATVTVPTANTVVPSLNGTGHITVSGGHVNLPQAVQGAPFSITTGTTPLQTPVATSSTAVPNARQLVRRISNPTITEMLERENTYTHAGTFDRHNYGWAGSLEQEAFTREVQRFSAEVERFKDSMDPTKLESIRDQIANLERQVHELRREQIQDLLDAVTEAVRVANPLNILDVIDHFNNSREAFLRFGEHGHAEYTIRQEIEALRDGERALGIAGEARNLDELRAR